MCGGLFLLTNLQLAGLIPLTGAGLESSQFNPEKSLMAIKQKYGKSRVKNLKPLNLRCLLTNQSADFTIRKISNVPHLISQDNASTSGFAPVKLSAIP